MSRVIVEIRPITEMDVVLLEENFLEGGRDKHARRWLRQQKAEIEYLIAWHQGRPVGHMVLNWFGSGDEPMASQLKGVCPDIEDLFVREELRSQGIGTQLLQYAERLVGERGYSWLGLSVGVPSNPMARRLYERLGFADAYFGTYLEHGDYVDEKGQLQHWEETCIYLVKEISTKDIREVDENGGVGLSY